MNLHQIRYFLALCETLNFTKAAQRCHVTQPSLTRAIKNLEHELGGPLIHRGGVATTLTRLGEAVRRELEQAQIHVDAARAAAETWAYESGEKLRLGVSTSAGPVGITRFLGAFQRYHQGIGLTIREASTDELLAELEAFDLDAALVVGPGDTAQEPAMSRLYEERLVVVLPAHHHLAALDTVPLAKLANETLLMGVDGEVRTVVLAAVKAAGVEVRIACHGARQDLLSGMVAEGAGVAIAPDGQLLPAVVTARPLSEPVQRQAIYLLLAQGGAGGGAIGRISEFATRYPSLHSKAVVAGSAA